MNFNVILLFTATVSGGWALQWTSSKDLLPGSIVTVCTGGDVVLPWNYQTEGAEHEIDVNWNFEGEDQRQTTIASYLNGYFLNAPTAEQHVTYVPGAGIKLTGVTSADSGLYTVDVDVNLHGSIIKHTQNITLQVTVPPVFTNGNLHASLAEEAVLKNGTWNIILTCGTFSSLGQPHVDVTWMRSSDNSTLSSSSYHAGKFLLSLPETAPANYYSCQPVGPAASCLQDISPSSLTSTVHVFESKVQLVVKSTQLTALQQKYDDLQSEFQREKEANHILNETILELTEANYNCSEHAEELDNFTQNMIRPRENCLKVQRIFPQSGVHILTVGNVTFAAYCDQSTDGGGWTVIQKRQDGSVNFNRTWMSYEDGFGDLSGEHWLGLAKIHLLTSSGQYSLRVDLEDFDGTTGYAVYDHFNISGPDDKYRLHVSGYHGTAGDSMVGVGQSNSVVNQQFSTLDRDNDLNPSQCAVHYESGWWFNNCMNSNLNGLYYASGGLYSFRGIIWYNWHSDSRTYKRAEMKIRPRG